QQPAGGGFLRLRPHVRADGIPGRLGVRQEMGRKGRGVAAMDDVKTLLFDVFGTVVDWRSSIAREVTPFLAKHAPAADPTAFGVAWRKRYQPAMEQVRIGARPFTRLDVLHRENLELVLKE